MERPRLRLLPIGRDVFRVYARHWKLLVPVALVVLLPQALGDALVADFEIERVRTAADVLKLATIPASVAINLGGEALYAGIVAAAVVHWRRGERLPGLRRISREIPVLRLIVVDAILSLGTGLGLVLLVVPGLVFYTYLAISPALIELRRLPVGEALRTSARLVRGSFWRVLVVIVAALVLTDAAGSLLESPIHGVEGETALNMAIHAALEPFQALATVLLALALIDLAGRRGHRSPSRGRGHNLRER